MTERTMTSMVAIARRTLLAAVLTGILPATSGVAQAYPSKPVTILVPFAAGGATDILARILAAELGPRLGQPVIVENRAGAGGGVGAAAVAKSSPNGHTLLLGTVSTHAINPAVYKSLGYDARKDFAAVAYVAGVPNVLVVNPQKVAAKTVAELVAEVREAGGKLNFASSGVGTSIHLSGEMFKAAAGLDMTHVPYRGSGPAIADLIGGAVEMMFDNLPSAMPHIEAGKLRALAVTSPTRSTLLPGVPTMAEAGIPEVEAIGWFALFAPAGTEDSIVSRLRAEVTATLAKASVTSRLATLGAEGRAMDGAELARFLEAELVRWANVARKSGAKVE
jgi:tripartite-type tricarboxylate transporter receptor subunit TctC